MSAVAAQKRPAGQGSSAMTPNTTTTPFRRFASALGRKRNEQDSLAKPQTSKVIPMKVGYANMERDGAFQSPLFHYASATHLPLSSSNVKPSNSSSSFGSRGRSATAAIPSSSLLRKPSEVLMKEQQNTPQPSCEADSTRRRALSQPTPPLDLSLQRKKSNVTSTARGAPIDKSQDLLDVLDMRSGTSSPAFSQGQPGRSRTSVSPRDCVSPLYGVPFPNAPLGRAEPRNAVTLINPDRPRGFSSDRSRTNTPIQSSSSAVSSPHFISRQLTEDRAGSEHSSEMIRRPMERGNFEQQFDHLAIQPSRHLEAPSSQRGDASESAEALLSLIRENRGSTITESTSYSSNGMSQSVSHAASDSLREYNNSHESSHISTLGSFSLHTVSQPLPANFQSQQRVDQDRRPPTDPSQFKNALKAFNSTSTDQNTTDSIASASRSQVHLHSTAQSLSRDIRKTLDEADIEIVEEQPILEEQTTLIGVRRRLVEEYEELGRRTGRILNTKHSFNMSPATDNSSPRSEGSRRPFDFASEKEIRKKAEDLEAREKELTIEALSKAEMAYVRIEIWTESRKGKWIIRGSVENDGYPPEELPRITDPWVFPIDSKGIVRRKKLKSNVELSSTRTIVDCPHCAEGREMGIHVQCRTCDDTTRVEMVYSVQCVVRLASFLPLKLPAVLSLGSKQPHIKYVDSSDPGQIIDILRDRAVDGLQTAAERVVKAHYAQHGSRLLMGRATIKRRGLLSVSVTSSKTKAKRHFDIEDGKDGKIVEVRPPQARSQSTPARSILDMGRKQSASQLKSSAKFGDSPSSVTSPPPFSNLVRKQVNESKSSSPSDYSNSTPPLMAALTGKPTPPPLPLEREESPIKRKKSIRDMFYR